MRPSRWGGGASNGSFERVITLNRFAAVALTEGLAKGALQLDLLEGLAFSDCSLLPTSRADLLRRLGHAEASEGYRAAIEPVPTDAKRGHLPWQLTDVILR